MGPLLSRIYNRIDCILIKVWIDLKSETQHAEQAMD